MRMTSDAARSATDPLSRLHFELSDSPFNRWIEAEALEADDERGHVLVGVRFRQELGATSEVEMFHGGVIAAVIDMTGHAVVAIRRRARVPTIALQTDYLAPAAGPELRAKGILRKLGRSIARADVEVTIDGRLVALGRGTFSTQEKS
jgi:uncharacterized protein (TIGR00369 family)